MAGMPLRRMRRNGLLDMFKRKPKEAEIMDEARRMIVDSINAQLPQIVGSLRMSKMQLFLRGTSSVNGHMSRMDEKYSELYADDPLKYSAAMFVQAGFLRSAFDRDCLGVCRVGVKTPHWDVRAKEILHGLRIIQWTRSPRRRDRLVR